VVPGQGDAEPGGEGGRVRVSWDGVVSEDRSINLRGQAGRRGEGGVSDVRYMLLRSKMTWAVSVAFGGISMT